MEEKTVLVIGTLDTKGEECIYIRDLLRNSGLNSLLIDTGSMGEPIARGATAPPPPPYCMPKIAQI